MTAPGTPVIASRPSRTPTTPVAWGPGHFSSPATRPRPGVAIRSRRRTIDLALIRLAEPLPGRFSAAGLVDGSLPRAGSSITLAGYGVSREGEARSTGTYRSAALTTVEPYGPGRILLWAADGSGGGKRPGAGACQGDSGGPILAATSAGYQLYGITSWSSGPLRSRQPSACGGLTAVTPIVEHTGWIASTMRSLSARNGAWTVN